MDLKHIIPQQRRRSAGPALDIQYSVDRTNVSRVGPTPTFTRASSGTFVNENGRIVGKTTSTTSLNPASVSVGGVAVFEVPSGSVVGWLNNSVVSVMVDSDGNDQIDAQAHVTGTLIHKTDTAITLLVTSKLGSFAVSSWFVSYRGQRITHDPVTGKCLGTLIEPTRTNIYLQSQGFDTVAWSVVRLVSQPVANTEMSPDGTQSAEKLVPSADNDNHRIDRASSAGIVANSAYSFSIFAKASGYTGFGFGFGTSTTPSVRFSLVGSGSVTFQATGYTATITPYPDGWYRCVASFTSPASGTRSYLSVGQDGNTFSYAGDGTSGIILWGAQLEAGPNATSYIPTTVVGAARSVDLPTILNAASTFNSLEGTLLNQFLMNTGSFANFSSTSSIRSASTANDAVSNEISGSTATTFFTRVRVYTTAINNFTINISGSLPILTLAKQALAYKSGNTIAARNGSLSSLSTTPFAFSTPLAQINIGNNYLASVPLNGILASVRYYRDRLPNAQLQTLTSTVSETIVYNGVAIWYNGEGLIETS